ncbi:hypothetical protein ACIO93_24910 [Streptomyces sp. NPDC087903]|uniref:hypothetical protein n=1 Tax=Streptomyces sp. NPDC087903 TaxID=3365819 RepID=UPI0037F13899
MDGEEHHCPACGQPVDTVVRRHKTLGAWVPVWVAGPCRNPRCDAYAAEDTAAVRRSSVREGSVRKGAASDEEPGEPAEKES